MINKFNHVMQLAITAVILLVITAVSIPTHQAAAGGGLSGDATLGMQIKQQAELAVSAYQNTLTAGSSGITAGNTTSLLLKENVLDTLAWAVAKQMVSQMTTSLVNWINSGFEGSPAFVTDLNAFLLDALDTVAGEYIKSLGGIGEFICSPFQLDIQTALTESYDAARSGLPSGGTLDEAQCKLSDIGDNIEGFFAGTSEGGWGEWLNVTSNPQNTPYGAYLEAQNMLNIKLQNEAGQEIEVASWGDGFLSKKICEEVEGASGGSYGQTEGTPSAAGAPRATGNCTISTPGQVISEALTFQLSTGPRSLIEADEINEIIGALLNQLTLKAMEGINGLLGMSEGTGYTDYSLGSSTQRRALIDQSNDTAIDLPVGQYKREMEDSLVLERSYLRLASNTLTEASVRLRVVAAGQVAIDNLFAGEGAELLGLTKSDTPSSTLQKLITAGRSSPSPSERTILNQVDSQLIKINDSLDLIKSMSNSANLGSDLSLVPFARLESEGTAIRNELESLVDNLNTVVPRILTNITTLEQLIKRYENAPERVIELGTASTSVQKIREAVALEYADLLKSGKLSTEAEIDRDRARWKQKLEIN